MITIHRYNHHNKSGTPTKILKEEIKLIRTSRKTSQVFWKSVLELNNGNLLCLETVEEINKLIEIEIFNNKFEDKLNC